MTILDEIQQEAWHILTALYTYQRMAESAAKSATRYELANHLVSVTALAEMLVIRVARLADRTKGTRSVSMLIKRSNFAERTEAVEQAAKKFLSLSAPVMKIRHEQVAHMRPGILSSYPLEPLPLVVIPATEALIDLIDVARGKAVSYVYQVGSVEAKIDLRASLESGSVVTA